MPQHDADGAVLPQQEPQRPRQAIEFAPVDDQPPPALEFVLWAEHEPALQLFRAAGTQWRHGPAGPTGLDYCGVRALPHFRRLPRETREAIFDDAIVIERAWLTEHYRLVVLRRQQQQQHPH